MTCTCADCLSGRPSEPATLNSLSTANSLRLEEQKVLLPAQSDLESKQPCSSDRAMTAGLTQCSLLLCYEVRR